MFYIGESQIELDVPERVPFKVGPPALEISESDKQTIKENRQKGGTCNHDCADKISGEGQSEMKMMCYDNSSFEGEEDKNIYTIKCKFEDLKIPNGKIASVIAPSKSVPRFFPRSKNSALSSKGPNFLKLKVNLGKYNSGNIDKLSSRNGLDTAVIRNLTEKLDSIDTPLARRNTIAEPVGIYVANRRSSAPTLTSTTKVPVERRISTPILNANSVFPQHMKYNNRTKQLDRIQEESDVNETGIGGQLELKPRSSGIRWVGVNGHEHQEQNQPSPKSPEVSHFYYSKNPTTPHIIISPDVSEHQTEFQYPDDLPNESKESSERNPDSSIVNIDDPANSQCDQTSPDIPSSAQKDLEGGVMGFIFSEDEDGGKLGPSNKANSLSRDWSFKGIAKSPLDHRISNGDTASGSSVNNSPTDENASPYFQKKEGQQFVNPGPMPVQRWDNNTRSMSMASLNLDSFETYGRKTRRKSTISLMRRVASQNNMLGQPSGLLDPNPQMRRSSSRGSLLTQNFDWRKEMNESLILCISALYGKLLVVMGMAFPIAEVISDDVPRTLYDSFYLYLYFGSISFLVYAYLFLLRRKSLVTGFIGGRLHRFRKYVPGMKVSGTVGNLRFKKDSKGEASEKDDRPERTSMSPSTYKTPKYTIIESNNHGSMYLKMGACVFGIGSMIYSGLEFGQYFELSSDKGCANILLVVKPIGRMLFTFLQMYFIFLNSRVAISKHTVIARFGLMHMVATNLCIWLNVLVQETKHEIYNLTDHGTSDFVGDDRDHAETNTSAILSDSTDHHNNFRNDHSDLVPSTENIMDNLYNMTGHEHNIVKRGTAFHDHLSGCRYINLMGDVVNEASPFLFPCTIEYSLLCSGVLYVMWKNINVNKSMRQHVSDADSDISTFIARKVRHHYSVDCARASRGLFMGIFVLVLTIISLILFYVLMSNDQFKDLAILEANICELCIYSVSIVSVIYGMKQMRELEFIPEGEIELDNILLLIAQSGVYVYTSFTIIGGYFNVHENHTLNLMTASVTLIQATLQTLFILDGSRRCCATADQLDRKPGREMVTFLVVCNLAMWAISTFETSRADVHPTQLHFYGVWAWTILSHVSMPLAIFYRFHVTVCLGEIWKKSYKLKNEFLMNL